jgi:hypothetical protein
MVQGQFGGSVVSISPYTGIKSIPSFLVGDIMTIGINSTANLCSFDSGPIHAYGLRTNLLITNQSNTELIYSGLKYNGNVNEIISQVVYKYFPNAIFDISTYSYIWFFTMTPRAEGVTALNA